MIEENNDPSALHISSQEEKARSDGWMPLEEWTEQGNDPSKWVSPEVFNVRGEFIGQLKGLKQELRNYQSAIDELKNHNTKLAKKEQERVINDLRQVKSQAIKEGDGDKVNQVDKLIDDLKAQGAKNVEVTNSTTAPKGHNIAYTVNEVQSAFESWKQKNSWYGSDEDMTQSMDDLSYAAFTRKVNQGDTITISDIEDIYRKSEQKVKKLYDKTSNQSNASKVESGDLSPKQVSSKTKGIKLSDFPENKDGINYRQIAKRFKDTGAFASYDEYYTQLKEIGAI